MTIRDKWYSSNHKRNLKTFEEIVTRIRKGLFYIVNIEFVADNNLHRLTIYLREKEQ